MFLNFWFFEHSSRNNENNQITGIAIVENENLNHKFPKATLTTELHKFAHKITHIALLKSRTPAATKDTIINATAVLHCNNTVATVPVHIDLNNVFVVFCISTLSEFVVSLLIASSNKNIHKRNNHNHHIISKMFSSINTFLKI